MILAERNSYRTRADIQPEVDFHEKQASFHEQQAKRHRERVTELEQMQADLDGGVLKERHAKRQGVERFPVVVNTPLPIGYVRAGQAIMQQMAAEQLAGTPVKRKSPDCFKPWCGMDGKLCVDCSQSRRPASAEAAHKTRADKVQEIVREIEQLDTLIAQLEQQLVDLDKPQGVERYVPQPRPEGEWTGNAATHADGNKSPTAPCPYCHSPLRVSDERFPARRLSEAELAELDEIAEEEASTPFQCAVNHFECHNTAEATR